MTSGCKSGLGRGRRERVAPARLQDYQTSLRCQGIKPGKMHTADAHSMQCAVSDDSNKSGTDCIDMLLLACAASMQFAEERKNSGTSTTQMTPTQDAADVAAAPGPPQALLDELDREKASERGSEATAGASAAPTPSSPPAAIDVATALALPGRTASAGRGLKRGRGEHPVQHTTLAQASGEGCTPDVNATDPRKKRCRAGVPESDAADLEQAEHSPPHAHAHACTRGKPAGACGATLTHAAASDAAGGLTRARRQRQRTQVPALTKVLRSGRGRPAAAQ